MNFELSLLHGVYNYTIHIKRSLTETRLLQTDAVKHKVPHMPIVTHEYLMSLTILSANTKCCAVPIVADRADFVPGPHLQNGTEYELQTFTVISSLCDVSL